MDDAQCDEGGDASRGTPTRKETAKQHRHLRSCPVPGCRVQTLKLAQHLQKSKAPGHALAQKSAQALAKSAGRCPRTQKGRLRKFCSDAGCGAYVADIPHHMRTVHRTTKASSTRPISPRASPEIQQRNSPEASPPRPDSPQAGPATPRAMRNAHKTGTPNAGEHEPPPADDPTPSRHIGKSGKLAYGLHVRRYYDFLLGLEGGCKSPKNATQYCRTVQTFWNWTGTAGLGAFSRGKLVAYFKTRYADVKASKVAPGTVRSELTCVISYLRYALLQGLDIPDACSLIEICHNMSASMRFAVAERRGTRAEQDFQTAILPPLARRFFETSPYVERIIAALNGTKKPSDTTLSQARGVLMVLISICIGSRISSLINMTAIMVQKAALRQPTDKPPCRIIGVPTHKTTVSRGPAEIPVATHVWRTLIRFIEHTGASGETPVFRDINGRGYHNNVSNATYHVSQAWRASGAEANFGPYNITRARKSLTSTAREADAGLADPVAEVLMHSRATADRYYMLANKKRVAAETFGSLELVQAAREKKAKADTVSTDACL